MNKDYFLANLAQEGFVDFLDFQHQKNGKVRAYITVAINPDNLAVSIPNAPFGGFWCEKGVDSDTLERFIRDVQTELKKLGVKKLQLVQAPKPYESSSELINFLLFRLGFKQVGVLSHQFFCGSKKIKKFLESEGPKYRKKLKAAGLSISHSPIENFEFLDSIKQWNRRKGFQVNLDENQLIRQVSEFPSRYFLIKLTQKSKPVGYALAVKLTSNSIYYFLSALESTETIKNGGDYLLQELFSLAREQKVDFIDLGSSATEEAVNHSLMFFKARFSNDISNKITWIKNL